MGVGGGRGGGGRVNQKLKQVTRELWGFLTENGITIAVEHLHGKLNTLAGKESRKKGSSMGRMGI